MKLEIPRSFAVQGILHRHRTIHSGPMSFSLITVHDLTLFIVGHAGSFAKTILRKISQVCGLDPVKSFTSIWSCTTQVDSGVKLAVVCRCSSVRQGGHGTGKTGFLVLTFSRQGKHREFCFDTGKNSETQGKYFSVTQGKI